MTANSGRDRTTCWVYSVGWTHHTVGRADDPHLGDRPAAARQHGPSGRRHPRAARARQHPGLDRHPDPVQPAARLPADAQGRGRTTRSTSTSGEIASPDQKGFWTNAKSYTVNLLKAWWGDAATEENDFAFHYLPKLTGDHGTYATVMSMLRDEIDGYFLLGQNPAVGSAHGKMQRMGLSHLKWLVVRDLNLIESATFWKDAPEIETGRAEDRGDRHRGVLLPGGLARGEGRHVHPDPADAAVAPQGGRAAAGTARASCEFFYLLGQKIRAAAGRLDRPARPAGPRPDLGLPARRGRRDLGRRGAQGDQRLLPDRGEGRASC